MAPASELRKGQMLLIGPFQTRSILSESNLQSLDQVKHDGGYVQTHYLPVRRKFRSDDQTLVRKMRAPGRGLLWRRICGASHQHDSLHLQVAVIVFLLSLVIF